METCELGFMLEGRKGLAAPVATEKSLEDMQMYMHLSPHDISVPKPTIYSNKFMLKTV